MHVLAPLHTTQSIAAVVFGFVLFLHNIPGFRTYCQSGRSCLLMFTMYKPVRPVSRAARDQRLATSGIWTGWMAWKRLKKKQTLVLLLTAYRTERFEVVFSAKAKCNQCTVHLRVLPRPLGRPQPLHSIVGPFFMIILFVFAFYCCFNHAKGRIVRMFKICRRTAYIHTQFWASLNRFWFCTVSTYIYAKGDGRWDG